MHTEPAWTFEGMDKYTVLQELGSGSTSTVYLVKENKTNLKFAAKVVNRKEMVKQNLTLNIEQEIRILEQIDHKNIVHLKEVIYTEESIVAILEYAASGDLYECIEKNCLTSLLGIQRIFAEIVHAVAFLHSKGIYHLDLKPENILMVAGGGIRLTDFGSSQTSVKSSRQFRHGSLHYLPPELVNGHHVDPEKFDVWSLGIILYVLTTSSTPWNTEEPRKVLHAISKGIILCDEVPSEAGNVIKACCNINPACRPTAKELLQFPFLSSACFIQTKSNSMGTIFSPLKKPHITLPFQQVHNKKRHSI